MIRFCDREVQCLLYEDFNRGRLISYFLSGHMDDLLCIVRKDGSYVGKVTYRSLLGAANADEAIQRESVVFDDDIWKNAKRFFACYEQGFDEHVLLPIVNKVGELICFAYEDMYANREMRMLQELLEYPEALQFQDIYPDIVCVKIHEFNELAYFFVKYLENQRIPVKVSGDMWSNIYEVKNDVSCLDYACMTLYAEGVGRKSPNWTENLLRSVCVEFECIDKIYEANINEGIIKDAVSNWKDIRTYLQGKQVAIIGTGLAAQDAYDFLLAQGIEACCFVNSKAGEKERRLFAKKVCSRAEFMRNFKDVVVLDGEYNHSAWGNRESDYYDYMGYRRNVLYFMLEDYVSVPQNGLKHSLANAEIILAGDLLLCEKLSEYLCEMVLKGEKRPVYIDLFSDIKEKELNMSVVDWRDIREDMLCLMVFPELELKERKSVISARKKDVVQQMKEHGVDNITDYFSYIESFVTVIKDLDRKTVRKCFQPQMNVLGAIEAYSGNIFFRGLLDNHPSILMISEYGDFNNNLFWICVQLAGVPSKDVLPLFFQIFKEEGRDEKILLDESAFSKKMEDMLKADERYTSQELFVMFHLAYMYMCGKDITDISERIIYWEPHNVQRMAVEKFSEWLDIAGLRSSVVNVIRNVCMRSGSKIKSVIRYEQDLILSISNFIFFKELENPDYEFCKRYVVRFEDIKCSPKDTLQELCAQWEIPWSETLMETTKLGRKSGYDNGSKIVYDFDTAPVYNTYEEYFSGFDRFRLMLLNAPWQKRYGYPYVDASDFSQRELQEMFLKEVRFEEIIKYSGRRNKLESWIRNMNNIRDRLWRNKMLEFEEKPKQVHNQKGHGI